MSNRTIMQRRLAMLAAASLAGLGFAASPALAGSDGDEPPAIEQPPAPPPPAPLPLPEAPAPTQAPAPAPAPEAGTQGEQATNRGGGTKAAPKSRTTRPTARTARPVSFKTTRRTVSGVTTIPSGGVQAGAGGTSLSPATPSAAIGLAGGSLVLLLTSGGLVAARRRSTSS
jgi:hypothetical protein